MKQGLMIQNLKVTTLFLIMIVGTLGTVLIQTTYTLNSTTSDQTTQQQHPKDVVHVTGALLKISKDTSSSTKEPVNLKEKNTVSTTTSMNTNQNNKQNLKTQPTSLDDTQPSLLLSKNTATVINKDLTKTGSVQPASLNALTVNILQSRSSVDIGQSETISASVFGGTSPYTYAWSIASGSGCSAPGNVVSFTCTPSTGAGSTFSIKVTVFDSGSLSGLGQATLIVNTDVSVSGVSATPSSGGIDVGQTVSFSVTPSGGSGSYSYTWASLPTGCSTSSANPLSCTPSGSGTFTPYVTVTSSGGSSAQSSSLSYTVIQALTISTITATPGSGAIDVGQTTTFSFTAGGGTGSYSYSWGNLPTGCSSQNTNSLSCKPTGGGTFTITGTVTDSNSNSKSNTLLFLVKPALTVSLSLNPGAVDLSQTATFKVSASGGSGLGYSYSYPSLPTGCSSIDTNSLSCKPSATGVFTVTASVTDSNSNTVSDSATFTVYAVPTISIITASPSSGGIDVGQQTTFSVSASSGSGGFSYSWSGLPTGCVTSNTNSLACTPTAPNTYTINVTATDSDGYSVTSSNLLYLVRTDPSINIPSPSIATNGIDIGQSITFSTSPASGGSGGYSYNWGGLPQGCVSSNSLSISCKPTVSGTFSITISVTDSNGKTITSGGLTYSILTDPSTTTPSGTPTSGNIDVSQGVTFSTTASGGAGGYSYVWYGLPTGCTTSNTNSLNCNPTASGTFVLYVNVTDSNGFQIKSATLSYSVLTDPTVTTPSASITSGNLDVGQSVTFSVTAAQGSGGYSYAWNLPAGCVTANSNSLSCSPNTAGTFNVNVNVSDSNGFLVTSGTLSYTVMSTPTITTPIATPASVDDGQVVIFSVTASGGSGYYSYTWNGYTDGCIIANSNSIKCTPTLAGTYNIYVNMTDSNNYQVISGTLTFYVLSNPTVTTPSASRSSVDIGQSVTFSVTASGGTGSGTYSYSWSSLPTGCSNTNSNSITCSPTASGTFSISVTVTDGNSYQITSSSLSYTVFSDPTVSVPTANISSGGIDAGQPVSFASASALGGYGSYSYSWSGLPTGCSDSGLSTVVCSNPGQGVFNVIVSVTDSNGFTVISSPLSFKVLPDPAISSFTSNTTNIDLSQTVSLSVSANSGTGSYTYSYSLDNSGCTGNSASASITCVPSNSGIFTFNVTVTDANGFSVTSSNIIVTVNPDPSVGAISYSIPSGGIDAGQYVTFTSAVPTGGYGTYQYSWNSLPTGCTDSGTNSVSCSPSSGGTFTVSVVVTDGNGYSVQSPALTYVVYSTIVVNTPSANVSSVDLGQSVNFSVTASAGTGSYSYSFNGLPLGCSSASTTSISCVPSTPGSYSITVSVTDSNHATVTSSSLSFSVYPLPSASTPSPSVSSVTVGNSVTFTTTVTGGSGNFAYTWDSVNGMNCATSSTNSITCTPTLVGSYTVNVTVTDSNGLSTTASSSTFTVNPVPTSITSHPSSSAPPSSSTQPSSNSHSSIPTTTKPSKHSPGFTTLVVLLGIIMSAGLVTFNRRNRKH